MFKKLFWICFPVLFVFSGYSYAQQSIDYRYDNLGRLSQVIYDNGPVIEYHYDILGNRIEKQIIADNNSSPFISDISNHDIAQNSVLANVAFTISDNETPTDELVVTGTSSNKSLVPDSSISFGGSGENRILSITPADDQHGATTITVTASDSEASASTSFVLTVLAPGNNPPTAFDDNYSANQGQTLSISATGVLENDTDPENDALTAELVSYDGSGALTLNANGSFTYTHDGSASTTDSFTYKAYDGELYSNIATVNITVNAATAAPEISVQGAGIPISDGDATPSLSDQTDFGNVAVGTYLDQTFTINNTGNANLTLNGSPRVSISGTGFSIQTQPTSPIAPAGSKTFVVRFAPTATGTINGNINIANNDSDENPYSTVVSL